LKPDAMVSDKGNPSLIAKPMSRRAENIDRKPNAPMTFAAE